MANIYLITGGAGFIGSHLVLHLASTGNSVRVLDNFSRSSRSEFEALIKPYGDCVEIVEGDIRDRKACREGVNGAQFILHHAAMASVVKSIAAPDECIAVNVLGTSNLLIEAAATGICDRFVFASSSAVYGNLPGHSKNEESPEDPLSPYATTKLAGEYLCKNFTQIHGLPTVSLRYFNVFGLRQDPNGPYAAVIPKFVEAILSGKSPIIYGDGEQSRDFVAVDDIVQANLRACHAGGANVSNQVFNIGSGRDVTVNQVVKAMGQILGRSIEPVYAPAQTGEIRHSLADIMKARSILEFVPTIQLEQGLRALLL